MNIVTFNVIEDEKIVRTVRAPNVMIPHWLAMKNSGIGGGKFSNIFLFRLWILMPLGGTPTLSKEGLLSVPWGICYRLSDAVLTPQGDMIYQFTGTFNPPLATFTVRGFGLTASHEGCANQLLSFISLASPIVLTVAQSLAFVYDISMYQASIPE